MSILDAKTANSRGGGPSFSLTNRLYRLAWMIAWKLLASWTPRQLNFWRVRLLRLFGADIHPRAQVFGGARIWSPANLIMHEGACIGPGANVYSMAKITLGAWSMISQRAHLCAGTHDIERDGFQLFAKPITIGAHCWIAAEAFVGPGVAIGEGSVLGARGCAIRDLEAWTIYSGNPAGPLRLRRWRPSNEG